MPSDSINEALEGLIEALAACDRPAQHKHAKVLRDFLSHECDQTQWHVVLIKRFLATNNSLRVCLRKAFERRDLNPDYPFGKRNYHRRFTEATQHLCPKRLAFVKDVIAKGL